MSASMSLPKTLDGLETIKTLLTTFNLKEVIAAQEEIRKQLKLTQAQEGEFAAAQSFIAQYKSLEKALKDREDVLATEKTQHELDKKQHTIHVTSENIRLEAFAAKLNEKDKAQAEIDKKQRNEAESLAGQRLDYERQHREKMAELEKQLAISTAQIQANAAKEQLLNEREVALKRKAELIRQQMANF